MKVTKREYNILLLVIMLVSLIVLAVLLKNLGELTGVTEQVIEWFNN